MIHHNKKDRKISGNAVRRYRDISLSTAEMILQGLNCSRALSVFIMMQYHEWDQIAQLQVKPADYNTAEDFDAAYQATNLLRKASHINTSFDTKRAALDSVYESEQHCKVTNLRLIRDRNFPKASLYHSVFHTARRLIANVLGELDPNELLNGCSFGPGVSSSVKGDAVSSYYKALGKLEVTPHLDPIGMLVINNIQPLPSAYLKADGPVSILSTNMRLVRGNRVTFVPKDAKTDRPIAIEPHINILIQKGLGAIIRSKLLRVGIDLRRQDYNRSLARSGSISNELMTVDLSSASDNISIELVRELMPPTWFTILNLARSHYGLIEGKWTKYEKFSSMGNGFTFELETLLFWALTKSVAIIKEVSGTISVYGDDIIGPSILYEDLLSVFTYCGFQMNGRKTFHDSPFRESCGGDYFLGKVVTSFYIKDKVVSTMDKISLHNRLFQFAFERYDKYFPAWITKILSSLRGKSNYVVHHSLGDVGFWSLTAPSTSRRQKNGLEGTIVQGLILVPTKVKMIEYYAALYHSFVTTTPDSASLGYTVKKNHVRKRTISLVVQNWGDPIF